MNCVNRKDIINHQQALNKKHQQDLDKNTLRANPGYLYHATHLKNLASIMSQGLGAKQLKNFKKSQDGEVCLAITWDLADSYAAEYQGLKFCCHAILEVDCLDLDLQLDDNEKTQWLGRPISYAFRGIIEPERLRVHQIRMYESSYAMSVENPFVKLNGSHVMLREPGYNERV